MFLLRRLDEVAKRPDTDPRFPLPSRASHVASGELGKIVPRNPQLIAARYRTPDRLVRDHDAGLCTVATHRHDRQGSAHDRPMLTSGLSVNR